MVFEGFRLLWIHILDKNKFWKFYIETEKQRIQNITFPQISKKPTKILMIPQYMCLLVIQINRLTWLIRPSYEVFTGYKQYKYKNTKSCFWDS